MTAPLFFLDPGGLDGAREGTVLLLTGPEGHHASTVRRLTPGEALLLADGSGLLAEATVVQVRPGQVSATVLMVREATPAPPRLVLVQALAKHDRDERAVEMATELGVDEVVAWQAGRSVVQWRGERGEKALRKWASVALAAAKQARRATVPLVGGPVTTSALAARVGAGGTTYVLHEGAERSLAAETLPGHGEVLLVVGPEGGISPEELSALRGAGALPVRLGAEVLRSSSAGPAALAVVLAATRWR